MSELLILFDQEFYKRHDGVVIGPTPNLSSTESTLMMVRFLPFCSKHHKNFRNYLNRQHKNIRFTSETVSENSLVFLH